MNVVRFCNNMFSRHFPKVIEELTINKITFSQENSSEETLFVYISTGCSSPARAAEKDLLRGVFGELFSMLVCPQCLVSTFVLTFMKTCSCC